MNPWPWFPMAGCLWVGASLAMAVYWSKVAALAGPAVRNVSRYSLDSRRHTASGRYSRPARLR